MAKLESDRLGNNSGRPYFTSQTPPQDNLTTVLDSDWAKRAFMTTDIELRDPTDVANRYWSSADFKFTDTSIGKSIGVNPRPQFTRYADPRRKGRVAGRSNVTIGATSGNFGMGRYYSEAIDDNAQIIYLRFGVPEYTGLLDFLGRAFDPDALHLAKTGRERGILFNIGAVIGGFVGIIAFPAIAALMFMSKAANIIFNKPRYKFYTFKPTMHNYWSSVNLLVNTLAINLNIMPKVLADTATQKLGKEFKVDAESMKIMHELLPNVFSEDGYIDMFAVANRAQMAANRLFKEEYDSLDSQDMNGYVGYLKKNSDNLTNSYTTTGKISIGENNRTVSSVINRYGSADSLASFISENITPSKWFNDDRKGQGNTGLETSPNTTGKDGKFKPMSEDEKDGYFKYLDSEFRSGSQFAVFRVNFTKGISESFSNSVGESEMSKKLNNTVSQAREIRFSLGDGDLVGGVAGKAVESVVGGVTDLLSGAAAGVTFGLSSSIMSMLKGAYLDIPKSWNSSTANLPKASYSMTLISPYGNAFSMLQNIYMPLLMLMSGSLPLATGKGSYTSPFLCQLYDRGKIQIKTGMIESLTITRGTSNLAYTADKKALAIDVSFDVVDLSSIMSMPISPAGFKDIIASIAGSVLTAGLTGIGVYNPAIDEDNILADYLAVLAGQDIYSQMFPLTKARLNGAKAMIRAKQLSSPAAWASWTKSSADDGILKYTPVGLVSFVLEGTVPPAQITDGTNM